jgi:hypothetical protein
MGAGEIGGEDIGVQAVTRIVGDLDRLIVIAVGEMDILHQVRRIEERDQVLGQHGGGGDAELFFGQKYGPGLGYAQRGPGDREVHVGRCGPVGEPGRGYRS